MAARIPLVKSGSATSGPTSNGLNASVRIRLDDPPFIFDAPATDSSGRTWGGSILIQQSMNTPPMPNNGGGVANDGITDANAVWETIGTLTNGGGPIEWRNPLYRIRANTSGVTGTGTPDVYMLVGIRSLKSQKILPRRPTTRESRSAT